jgi:hypothetical protein
MNDELDVMSRLVDYHDHISAPSVPVADDVRRGRRRVRRNRGLLAGGAALGLASVVAAMSLFAGEGAVDRPQPADPPGPTTRTFVSPINGFAVGYRDLGDGTVSPATQLWGVSERADAGFDVVEAGSAAVFKGTSTKIPAGVSIDEWYDDYVSRSGCGVQRSQQPEITIDGQLGRIAECPNQVEATVVAGGRVYLFVLTHERSDARAFFDSFVATIDLRPETAVDIPPLTTTFVSPTYGYSFGYLDRGGLEPAVEPWDPRDGQLDNIQLSNRFDAVQTGLSAYFVGASTEIPDGVSIDEWYDEHVSRSGCGVPRSQQSEIVIDGQLGRFAVCPNQIEATVVAGGRLYLFMLGHERSDAAAFFAAWIATIELTPETAAGP